MVNFLPKQDEFILRIKTNPNLDSNVRTITDIYISHTLRSSS